jgi:hypothetical protein
MGTEFTKHRFFRPSFVLFVTFVTFVVQAVVLRTSLFHIARPVQPPRAFPYFAETSSPSTSKTTLTLARMFFVSRTKAR